MLQHFFLNYHNELLWFLSIGITFSFTLLAFRLWGKTGLFVFAVVSTILANIQALKQVDLFGMHASMGDINYIGVYLISDILSENYGKNTARKIVSLGVLSTLIATILMYLCLQLIPNNVDQAQGSLNMIFGFLPRLVLASIVAFTVSQSYDIVAYQFWRRLFPAYRHIWIRNNLSTLISQFLDNSIFTLVAFSGVFAFQYVIEIFITSCVLRTIISVLDTPFVYWSVKIKPKAVEI